MLILDNNLRRLLKLASLHLSSRSPQRMRFRVQHILIQTHKPRPREYKVKLLQRLCHPKALHAILLWWVAQRDIVDACVCNISYTMLDDIIEHIPRSFAEVLVACDTIKNEDRFDGFWSVGRQSCLRSDA